MALRSHFVEWFSKNFGEICKKVEKNCTVLPMRVVPPIWLLCISLKVTKLVYRRIRSSQDSHDENTLVLWRCAAC